jgi:response regulator RpfG family c-di-GMP phosphodiesterase
LPHLDIENAAAAAERYRQAIKKIIFPELTVTASIGVSAMVESKSDPQSLLDEADKCLYVAKRQGRDRVARWDEIPDDVEIDESKIARAAPSESDVDTSIPFHAVAALVSALGYRDGATADHSRRVADLCVATASGLLSSTECYILEIAGLLHDIGKIGVPDSILLKPGPLTPEEWQIMSVHDRIGVEIVNSAFDCRALTEIIESHHAFFGGKGRHDSLPTGKDIPLGARLLTIADSYDAIVSDRVYRKGASQEEAFTELRRCAGTQFDPELIERFIQAVTDRDENRHTAIAPVSKQTALRVGSEIERLACAIDNRDKASLEALAGRLRQTSNNHGIPQIAEVSTELEKLAADDAEMSQLVEVTHTLIELCRATQSVFLNRIVEQSTFTAVADDQPLVEEATARG